MPNETQNILFIKGAKYEIEKFIDLHKKKIDYLDWWDFNSSIQVKNFNKDIDTLKSDEYILLQKELVKKWGV